MNFGSDVVFRQLFDRESSTYTYLLGDADSQLAILIDPVLEQTPAYLNLLQELQLTLVAALDTHTHADHITALGTLREHTRCATFIGQESQSECISHSLHNGYQIAFGDLSIKALHTPGHTNDSYSFVFTHNNQCALFTGDTLLIRGTGRTDFQQGSARDQYHSLFEILLHFPDDTWIYPAHDYKGWSVSTLAEEKAHNPRLQVTNVEQYEDLMAHLNLPNPKLMDIAVPANQACGKLAPKP